MKAVKSEHTRQPVPSIWGWIVSLVFFNDDKCQEICIRVPSLSHMAITSSRYSIGNCINFHILSIYYVQDCLRNFKRSKIMYINVENDPEIRFLENIELLKFSPGIFQKGQNCVYKHRRGPRNTISRKYWAIKIFSDNRGHNIW